MFSINPTPLPGCYEIQPRVIDDARGRFVKIFHKDAFAERQLETSFVEEYYSHSIRGVIRGLHFQAPPHDHVKIVYCVQGEISDVVLDIRVGSPTYGKTASFCLSAEKANYVYIPKGLAHGFCSTSETATVIYKVSTVYAPQSDSGVLWSSVGIEWPTSDPVTSERDAGFVPLSAFESPFVYEE